MGQHENHSIYTEQQRQLLQQAKQRALFSNHHHHHHHSHPKYQRPKQLTTAIALYSLKKLNAMEPKFLTVQQKRLLLPVAPGFISYVIHGAFVTSISAYTYYVYKGLGIKGFSTKAVIPLVGLCGIMKASQLGIAYTREFLFQKQRRSLVQKYIGKFGQNYLLDALNPTFRI